MSLSLQTFQALMVAAKCGQTNCVILLLKSRANSLVQSNREYKYLMEAISAGHRLNKPCTLHIKIILHAKSQCIKTFGAHTEQGFYCTHCVCICLSVSLLAATFTPN